MITISTRDIVYLSLTVNDTLYDAISYHTDHFFQKQSLIVKVHYRILNSTNIYCWVEGSNIHPLFLQLFIAKQWFLSYSLNNCNILITISTRDTVHLSLTNRFCSFHSQWHLVWRYFLSHCLFLPKAVTN